MRRLEETFGVTLFDRSKKIPQLNPLGRALATKAKAVVYAYDTILDDLTGDTQMIGELTLGAVPSTIRELIPRAIKKLVLVYPALRVRVVPALSDDLLDQVERGGLDAAVLSTPRQIGDSLSWQPFAEEELVLLAAPEVTECDPFKLIRTMPYIRHARRAAVGMLAEEWLLRNNVVVQASMEMESLETLASMVSHNLGVSIAPNICVPDPIFENLRKIPLTGTGSLRANSRVLGVLTRSDCSKSRLVERLLIEIRQTVGEYRRSALI